MAKCVHCGQRKGKRRCPAVEGDICTLCCGTVRGQTIECPETCVFWTGEHDTRNQRGENPFHRLSDRLADYARHHADLADDAAELFLDDEIGSGDEVEEWERANYDAFVQYGHAGEDGLRVVDHFAEEWKGRLPADERAALTCLQRCRFSLFEIQEVRKDEGLDLLDLVTDERVFVRERSATHQLVRYDCLAGFMGPFRDGHALTGGAVTVPRVYKDVVLTALREDLAFLPIEYPDADPDALLRETPPAVHLALREAFGSWRRPRMQTMDGEEIVLCEAVFDVADEAAVHSRLEGHDDFHADEDGFSWVDKEGRPQLGDDPLLLGSVTFGTDRLCLKVKSRERLERGKALLFEVLEGVATHRLDSIKDFDVALDEHEEGGPADAGTETIPPEVAAQVLAEHLNQHMRRWMDERIAALGNKTPREAVQTSEGRKLVVDLVKGQENLARRWQGGPDIDLRWVLQELGI